MFLPIPFFLPCTSNHMYSVFRYLFLVCTITIMQTTYMPFLLPFFIGVQDTLVEVHDVYAADSSIEMRYQ